MIVTKIDEDVVEVVVEFEGRTFGSLNCDWRWGDDATGELVTDARTRFHLHQRAGRILPHFRKN